MRSVLGRTLQVRQQTVHAPFAQCRRSLWGLFSAKSEEPPKTDPLYVQKMLFRMYASYVAPLERQFEFAKFSTPELTQADFIAPPLVLLLGQYSTGKTTMVEYLVGRNVPGSHTGPEPTTDRFIAITHGEQDRTIPGHAACSDSELPYMSLQTYGSSFLSKFEVTQVPSELLRGLTLVDSPGVLSGEKQRVDRGYDFPAVTQHLAERADRIILLFDCSKLDISDEFKVQQNEGRLPPRDEAHSPRVSSPTHAHSLVRSHFLSLSLSALSWCAPRQWRPRAFAS